ncbi:MAG: hypothetical protein RI885_701 [Actinomycetota bacterium]|jgi:hypothetical protein
MTARLDLPEPFSTDPFAVDRAHAAGIGRGRLRSRDLAAPFRGARVPASTKPPASDRVEVHVRWRCEALAPVLTGSQFFSHTTAAHLWGCPFESPQHSDDLHVSTLPPIRAARRDGVVGHQVGAEVRVIQRSGLRVADPASVFLQLAGMLPLDELVAAGDHLILDPRVLDPRDLRPYVTLGQLRERLGGWSGRGRRRAMQALDLMRVGADSRPETLLRLLLAEAGCPEPEVNPELRGIRRPWTHWADLVYRDRHVIVEYDGDQHRTDRRQYDEDIRRFEDFADDGWRVVRVRARGLFRDPADTVSRVRSALSVGGALPTA